NLRSREPPLLTQAGAAPRRRDGLAPFGPTGVPEQGAGTRGWLGNLRDPAVPTDISGSGTGTSTPRSPRSRARPLGANTAPGWYRRPKATKGGETNGRESERLIVASKLGNGPSRTQWSEGGAALWTGSRNHAEGIGPPSVSPRGGRIV